MKLMSKTQQMLIDNQYLRMLKFMPRYEKREVQIVCFFAWKITKIDSQTCDLVNSSAPKQKTKIFPEKMFHGLKCL